MKLLVLVPARGGSRRVEGKNLAVLGGRTLVRRALETIVAADCFAAVALSSEDPAILAEASRLPVTQLARPPALASDTATTLDVVLHALDALPESFDGVGIVQCTSPFTAPEDLVGAVTMLGGPARARSSPSRAWRRPSTPSSSSASRGTACAPGSRTTACCPRTSCPSSGCATARST